MMLRAAMALVSVAAAASAVGQPVLGPDESASAFIERWNAWALETDPEQRLLAELEAARDDFWEASDAQEKRLQVFHSLDDVAAPGNWEAAQAVAEAVGPHTARMRTLVESPHLALPFRSLAEEASQRRERAAERAANPEDAAVVFGEAPMPVNRLEMFLLDEGIAHALRSVTSQLRLEFNYAVHVGNIGLAMGNIAALLDVYRLQIERATLLHALNALATEDVAVSSLGRLLDRHGRRMDDGALERLQAAMLEHAGRRRGLAESVELNERVFGEVLPTWFDDEEAERLTEHGRAFLDAMGWGEGWAELLDPNGLFTVRDPPALDGAFAPASEQVRVLNAIADAYARDAARPAHSIDELESVRLFRMTVDADPEGRLAPALSPFYLYSSHIQSDVRFGAKLRGVLVMLGVHRHRARTGAWPESLAEIDPTIMRVDPIDPYSGEPFGYAVIDDEPVLWAAGPDRDDDDGRPIPEPADWNGPFEGPIRPAANWFTLNEWAALPPEVQAEHDGDIVLFPPRER